jgi:hypothetical protein
LWVLLGFSDDDQNPLKNILKWMNLGKFVKANRNEFTYKDGEFIKHFTRKNSESWTDINVEERALMMQATAIEVCDRYKPVCAITNLTTF